MSMMMMMKRQGTYLVLKEMNHSICFNGSAHVQLLLRMIYVPIIENICDILLVINISLDHMPHCF